MKDLIQQLKQTDPKDVVIVGDIMLDEYVSGSIDRISHEASVPVLREVSKGVEFWWGKIKTGRVKFLNSWLYLFCLFFLFLLRILPSLGDHLLLHKLTQLFCSFSY